MGLLEELHHWGWEDLDGNRIEDGITISLMVAPFTMLVSRDGDGLVMPAVAKFLESGRLQATYLLAVEDTVGARACLSTAVTELFGPENSFLV